MNAIAARPRTSPVGRHAERQPAQRPTPAGSMPTAPVSQKSMPAVRRGRGGGAGDRAAVAAEHEVDAVAVAARRPRRARRRGPRRRPSGSRSSGRRPRRRAFTRSAASEHAAVLVDATGSLGAARAGRRRPPRGRRRRAEPPVHAGAEQREAQRPRRSVVLIATITARQVGRGMGAAGTVHVPAAQRCQPNSSPAPRSTGNADDAVERAGGSPRTAAP